MWLLGLSRILQFGLVVSLDTLTSRETFETFALHNPDRIFYPKGFQIGNSIWGPFPGSLTQLGASRGLQSQKF